MEVVALRTCSKCNFSKPATSEFFYPNQGRLRGECKGCNIKGVSIRYHKDKQKSRDAHRQWKKNRPEKSKEKNIRQHLRRKYNMTPAEAEALYTKFDNKCGICNKAVTAKNRHIDHDHKTLAIRGILCFNCNIGLGNFKDSKELLNKAVQYLNMFCD